MTKLYISVISHGHENIILSLNCLSSLSKIIDFEIVLKINVKPQNNLLYEYCNKHSIHIIDSEYGCGFGENNNIVFEYCQKHLKMNNLDYFLVLNPDVFVKYETLISMFIQVQKEQAKLSTLNLFRDELFTVPDNCLRKFPGFIDFISSFMGFSNSIVINKNLIVEPGFYDWAAGSFLLFNCHLYKELSGFDTGYFMYCEDIDICWRAKQKNIKGIKFYPEYRAIHHAQHTNRNIFSKHFFWHIKSILRYLHMRYKAKNNVNSTST